MDVIDLRILDILQVDGRITMKELGKRVGLTSPATIERVKKLEETGVIGGYRAVIDTQRAGLPIHAFITVGATHETCQALQQFACEHKNVMCCHRITGDSGFMMEVAVANMANLEQMMNQVMPFGHIQTSIVLSSPVEYQPVVIPENNGQKK